MTARKQMNSETVSVNLTESMPKSQSQNQLNGTF